MNAFPTSTQPTTVGLIELPHLAAALAGSGLTVVTDREHRAAARAIKEARSTAGAFPVLLSAAPWPGLRAWGEMAAQLSRVVLLRGDGALDTPINGAVVVELPATVGAIASAAGLTVDPSIVDAVVASDGSVAIPAAPAPAPAPAAPVVEQVAPVTPVVPAPIEPAAPVHVPVAEPIAQPDPQLVADVWGETLAQAPSPAHVPAPVAGPVAVQPPAAPVAELDPWEEQVAARQSAPVVETPVQQHWTAGETQVAQESGVNTIPPAHQPVPPSVPPAAAASPVAAQDFDVNTTIPTPAAIPPQTRVVPSVVPEPVAVVEQMPDNPASFPTVQSVTRQVEPQAPIQYAAPVPAPVVAPVVAAPEPVRPALPSVPAAVAEQIYDMFDAPSAPAAAPAAARRPAGRPGFGGADIIVCMAAKGGVGKTGFTHAVAQRAAKADLNTILIDANWGQGDARTVLRLGNTNLPSIHQAAAVDNLRAGLIDPVTLTNARADGMDPIRFAAVLAPPSHLADDGTISPEVFLEMVRQASHLADVVVIDTQIIESQDATGMLHRFIEPLLRSGAWGLVVSDMSSMGVSNTMTRVRAMAANGVPGDRLMSVMNRVPVDADFPEDGIAKTFGTWTAYLGHAFHDTAITAATNKGQEICDQPAIAPLLDAALLRVTGDDRFNNSAPAARRGKRSTTPTTTNSATAKASGRRGWLKGRKK